MLHTSSIDLKKKALNNNICYMRRLAGDGVRYSMVVKANAYGHGIEELVPMIEGCAVDHLAVFSAAEARRVQRVKAPGTDLMIMGFIDHDHLDWAIDQGISFFVFTFERLHAALAAARRAGRPARLHIEVETGMHRTGFCEDELAEVARLLRDHPDQLHREGLCTHFAGAEDAANYGRVKAQMRNYHAICDWFGEQGLHFDYRHMACSAGLLRFPESALDMVRIGIANYGFWPSQELRTRYLYENDELSDPLERVLRWKSVVMSINRVPEGAYVSYGNSFMTNRDSRIATVPVGYGYGFSRTLSNAGRVLLRGRRVPVVGVVNMNMLVIDATDVPQAEVGDEVMLIGSQGGHTITVTSFSDMNNSLNYELLARLPGHIPRHPVE
jgi:alanine racemase